jgi:hypothetical protein
MSFFFFPTKSSWLELVGYKITLRTDALCASWSFLAGRFPPLTICVADCPFLSTWFSALSLLRLCRVRVVFRRRTSHLLMIQLPATRSEPIPWVLQCLGCVALPNC